MKILQVFDLFSPYHGGGTVDIIAKLSQELAERGHEVTICTSDFELDQPYIDKLKGVKVDIHHNFGRMWGMYLTPSVISKVDVKQYDIIHLHCFRSFQNVVLSRYAQRYIIPYIIEAHGSAAKLGGNKYLLKWLYDRVFSTKINRGVSRFIATTKVGKAEYEALGIVPSRITIIHPPFDVSEFDYLPKRGLFKLSHKINTEHMIIFLGRINRIKGLDFLVSSFSQLCKTQKDITLVLAGADDGYWSTLQNLIHKLKLEDRILYIGFISGLEKRSALVDADVLVQTSTYEQGAGSPIEAILCGTPAVVTRGTGAGEDIVSIDAGYLVGYGNVPELSSVIQYIINNPEAARVKIAKAKEWIRANLSLESQVARYEHLYQEVSSQKCY